jgi:pimeloyl-ACP methyl ester carboxylesterase
MPSTRPETRYAKSGDLNIAYQVVGDGPIDLIYVPGWISNVELNWEEPAHAHVLERLASFSRLILFDKRGTGLSDPVSLDAMPTLEERMDDVRAVLDAVDCEEAALFGFSEGGLMSVLFAATYPERITTLVLYGTFAKRIRSPDYPWAPSPRIARASSRSWSATGRCAWTSTFSHRARTTRSRIASQPISGEAPARAPHSR